MNRERASTVSWLEKKIGDMETKEKRLQEEIDTLKQERDRKIFENQAYLDKEKESFKAKINEVEKKLKESEQKKQALVFEFEKEKTRWIFEWEAFDS